MNAKHDKRDQHSLSTVAHDSEKALAFLSLAVKALSEADGIEEVKQLHDQAEMIRAYAKSASKGLDLVIAASEVRLRAEREGGKVLAQMHLRGGGRRSKLPRVTLKLGDLGISKRQSLRWQRTASVPECCFQHYLQDCRARKKEITSAGLLRFSAMETEPLTSEPAINIESVRGGLKELVKNDKSFACVYADPSWPAIGSCGRQVGCERDQAMRSFVHDLKRLPVRDLGAANSHLHLRTPELAIPDALAVLHSWGFRYGGLVVWRRRSQGFGAFWRPSCEILLLGVRGHLPFRDNGIASWVDTDTQGMGELDGSVRELIDRVSPGPRLDVFGNKPCSGWTVAAAK